jgi:signal transduction histidine kinase
VVPHHVIAPLYTIPVLIASQRLSVRTVGSVSALAIAVSVINCAIERTPLPVSMLDTLGLILTCWLAVLLVVHQRQTEQARRQVVEMTSFVTHDLRAPLATILGYVQLLERQVRRQPAPAPARLLADLAAVHEAADQMNGLIDELLDDAGLQEGQPLLLKLQPADLVQLVVHAVMARQRTAAEHMLCVHRGSESLVGLWDTQRLRRAVDNLISNAMKYSPDHGRIVIGLERETRGGRPWAVLTVQDNGLGIPAADLPHVFERFHRGANVTGRVAGTGLGLAGARRIIERHGGAIAIASEEGKGTTVTVTLPLAAE